MSGPPTLSASVRGWLGRHPRAGLVALNVLVALVYWLVGEMTLLVMSGNAPALWLPAGIALVAVHYGGPRLSPGVVAGSLAVLAARGPVGFSLVAAVGGALGALAGVRVIRALTVDVRLERVRDPIALAFGVAPAAALTTATLGAAVAPLLLGTPLADLPPIWMTWWLRDWVGALVASALLFSWIESRPVAWTPARQLEAAAIAVLVLLASALVFGLRTVAVRDVVAALALLPLAGWAALRFGVRGGAAAVALAAAAAIPAIDPRTEPFLDRAEIFAFVVLVTGFVSAAIVAAALAERDDARQRRRQLEEQLRHAQKMEAVGRLAGGVAHDFNNLLTAIIGYTEIVLTALDAKDPLRADAEEIGRAALRAADLTRQMLSFSRKDVVQPRNVDLNRALSKVEPMLRRLVGEDIVLTIERRSSRALVRVDPGQIEQVIVNLVVNARDAMPRGGRITIETSDLVIEPGTPLDNPDARPGDFVALSVQDTGTGIPPSVRARIFEPYFTTKDAGKGTGLGLSTAYGIVRQSEGHIDVSSEVNKGATFRVVLPRAGVEAKPDTDSSVQRLPGGAEHILIVEDDASVRHLAKDLLTRLGYSVTEAASGRAALALCSDDKLHLDLALCDVMLGDMSGPAVAEALQAVRPSIRVLFMSGYTDDAIVRTGVLEEGRPFLPKPFTPIQLARKIRDVLDDREAGAA